MCDKNPWTQFEDEALTSVINELQDKLQWCKVEKILKTRYGIKNRTGKQCRERWNNNLDPNCRKREWTADEDMIIFNFQQKMGNNWSKISKFLIGRSDNTIKNHFYATVRRKLRRYNRICEDKISLPVKEIIKDKELVRMLMEIPEKEKPDNCVEVYWVFRRRSSRILKKKDEASDGENDEDSNKSEPFSICTPIPVRESCLVSYSGNLQEFIQNSGSNILPLNPLGGFFGDSSSVNYSMTSMKLLSEYSQTFPSISDFQFNT